MAKLIKRSRRSYSAITTLIAAASGAVLVTVVTGLLVYNNTQQLISANKWVEHTQEVLSTLQRASLLTERIEYRSRLFLLTGDEDQLNRARTAANQLVTSATHLKTLVSDNPDQAGNVEKLANGSDELVKALDGFNKQSELPTLEIQHCQQIVSVMTDTEQSLLKQRDERSQRSIFTSVTTEAGAVGLWLLTSAVLLAFLVRDAMRRERVERKIKFTNQHLEQSVKALEDRAQEATLLTAARDELQLCMDVQQLYGSASRRLSFLLPETSGSLCMIDNSRQVVEVVSFWGTTTVDDFNPPEACCGLRSGQPRWRQPGLSEIHCTHFTGEAPECYVCVPIAAHGSTLGVLYVQCADEAAVQAVNRRMDGLRQLLQILAMSVATLNLQSKLENQSIRDALTGLFNRHFMQISLDRELSRAARKKQSLAVLMLDMDHFKRFNDTHGHAAGDAGLQGLANVLKSSIRPEDIACRYGGEEFTILLPDITVEAAYQRAETILQAVSHMSVSVGSQTYSAFTISIGIALYPNDGETPEQLLRCADEALYRSKRQGRNQATIYENIPTTR
ncbi:sensor domain-containing diguanylate cyclase [Terracidiphilus gabretensis]|uniref:sensor domain-containing diguanylate cyclase n=1 Tax=Terracidiphilus gabretensis TaxID=1577687 RepID=UPI00071BF912|nr:diguanylate cyclase [Terracidiphilus gabretensis]